ncbi:phosphotransferase family protein [Millisia brevis]|uniref:phosphotransferase family protein n=1 Tax=Millisia brevis TaxID=264148 RepID=UPI000831CAF5|nr:phosphotransferase [Millisia brevis]
MSVDAGTSADRAIVDTEPRLPGIDRVLLPDRLSELFGFPARVTRLRYKPGTSLVAAWRRADVEQHRFGDVGWIGVFADPVKLDKARRHAARCGARVDGFAGFPGMVAGDLWSDRPLGTTLHRLRTGYAPLFADATVVRHNPLRRLVVHSRTATGALAIKVSTHTPHVALSVSRSLAAAGHPVLPIDEIPGCPGATSASWWGAGTLGAQPSAPAAFAAGDALARVHRHETYRAMPAPDADLLRARLRPGAEAVAAVLPDLGPAAFEVADSIATAVAALESSAASARLHGDFSADQVLVSGSTIRLIDFDRTAVGPVERDLGSFAAAGLLTGRPETTDHLLRGYRAAGGTVDADRLRIWTARGLFDRAVEPFRTHHPGWSARVEETIETARDVLRGTR